MPGRASAAKRYAEAIAGIARQENSWERWHQDLSAVAGLLRGNDALRLSLESPRVRPERKIELLDAAIATGGAQIAAQTANMLRVMARRGRLGLLADVQGWFDELSDRALGVRRYTVTSALPLTPDQRERLQQQLAASGGQAVLTEQVDPSLLGGLILREGDIIRDYSVRTRLAALRERLN